MEQVEIIPSAVVGNFLSSILLLFRISDQINSITDYVKKQSIPNSDRHSNRLYFLTRHTKISHRFKENYR